MKEIILFIACFIVVFICYQVFFVLPMKKYKKNKKKKSKVKEKKELAEIRLLVTKYKLDLDKVNYNKLLLVVSLVSSFDITLIVTIITLFDSYLISFLLAAVLVLPIVMISYWLVYKFYEKRGMIKNV